MLLMALAAGSTTGYTSAASSLGWVAEIRPGVSPCERAPWTTRCFDRRGAAGGRL